ncbi:hypothetical protein BVG16_11575 [Paenibacillus selenitireducens]|uniref:Uncharacterized protein n=1 Tax=Paenibacillus selenitireducens TaxID=1324314 RepID=A0A1T2XF34_9BACL|nr:hypothetical protein [Paenibacillus selenitireducens]OPA78504.1 hypothetical protein BVG16_11575 [Paenibacillus selenitireducens]
MAKLLHYIGGAAIVFGIILGIIYGFLDQGFRFFVMLAWWGSGVISGIVFIALGMILETVECNQMYLHELLRRTPSDSSPPVSLGNSKASLSSLRGYKIGNTSEEEKGQ